MTKGIFITATGTDIGKTYVSGLIVKNMRQYGCDCGYFKPVLSGATEDEGRLFLGDCEFVLDFAKIKANPYDFVSYAFKTPVSPHLAASIEGKTIELSKIQKDFRRIKNLYTHVVVEGAGGLLCPFCLQENKKLLLPDVVKALGLNIIIVASSEIGTINSTCLTVQYAKLSGIKIKGLVLNNYDENNFMHIDNKKCLEELTGIKVIATVKRNQQELQLNSFEASFEEIME